MIDHIDHDYFRGNESEVHHWNYVTWTTHLFFPIRQLAIRILGPNQLKR